VLRLTHIQKRLGGRPVLRDVGLEIGAGETVALLGPNGSGKSTLLRIAGTLSRPDTGDLQVAGKDARRDPEAARRHLSTLTQEAPVYAELSPHEHLEWWSRLHGLHLVPDAIESAIVECGLEHHAHKPAGSLSRGQRQRLALALALLPERPLLLLDEPFTALDAAGRAWLDDRLMARRGKAATLVALHDEGLAEGLADRTVRLDHGVLR
jgi:heme ABC exporter ATP-binding subunit CcmA